MIKDCHSETPFVKCEKVATLMHLFEPYSDEVSVATKNLSSLGIKNNENNIEEKPHVHSTIHIYIPYLLHMYPRLPGMLQ